MEGRLSLKGRVSQKGVIMVIGVIVVLWFVYSIFQPPIWIGTTQNRRWKAIYNVELAPKDIWEGNIYWQGKGTSTLTFVQFIVDGSVGDDLVDDEKIELLEKDKYNFASLSGRYDKGHDLRVKLRWKEGDQEYEDTIILKPQKRLFILPKFIYEIF